MQDMNGHSAFALSPGLAPETNGDSERQGLRSGAYSAPLKKARGGRAGLRSSYDQR